jgi:predicted dehydrogenase
MGDKLRCAVIGAGAIGLEHINSLTHCARAACVAVAELNPRRGKEACDRFKIARLYADYLELLDQPDIDAVIVALPNHLHAPVTLSALQARKHVLVEKPMALNAREGARMVAAAEKMKRTLMVAQNFRFNQHTQIARHFLQRGEAGEIYHGRCFWLRRQGIPRIGSWFTRKELAGGGCAADIGVHLLDATLHLMGEFEAVSVSAVTHARFGPRGLGDFEWGRSEIDPLKPFTVEDFASAFIRLKSGRCLTLESSWAAHHAADAREYGIDLLGTTAGLSLFPARLYRPGPLGYDSTLLSLPKTSFQEDRTHHFVQAVLDNKPTLVPMGESLKVQQILDALYESARQGREVRLNPKP